MSTRRTAFHKLADSMQAEVANIDNCNYIIRTPDGRTIYTFSKKAAEHAAREGSEIFRRIRWYEDDI